MHNCKVFQSYKASNYGTFSQFTLQAMGRKRLPQQNYIHVYLQAG